MELFQQTQLLAFIGNKFSQKSSIIFICKVPNYAFGKVDLVNFSFAFFPSAFYQLGPRSQPECTRGAVTEVRLRLLITEVQFLNFVFETSSISQSSIKWEGAGGAYQRAALSWYGYKAVRCLFEAWYLSEEILYVFLKKLKQCHY